MYSGGTTADNVLSGCQDKAAQAALRKGAKYVPVNRSSGQADPKGPAICRKDGESNERPGIQI